MLSLYARLSGQLRPRRGSYNNANELAADLGLHPNQLSVSVVNILLISEQWQTKRNSDMCQFTQQR
jgi:hypothetical protein